MGFGLYMIRIRNPIPNKAMNADIKKKAVNRSRLVFDA